MNVSDQPDLRELLLAADVLVVDYASLQFDFAITGETDSALCLRPRALPRRPAAVLLRPHRCRPGRLLHTEDELLDALTDVDAATAGTTGRYARFRERFSSVEDGHATERVLDLVLSR